MIGLKWIASACKCWRAAYREQEILGLGDTHRTKSSRPFKREMTLEKKLIAIGTFLIAVIERRTYEYSP